MPKLATTHSLEDYPRLSISRYKDQLRPSDKVPAITLSYSFKHQNYQYDISVTTTACNYGGVRYWWKCPKCYKRVGVLYCAGLYVCRHCIGAKYQSQLIQPIDNHFKRIAELRQRLGWQGGLAHGMGGRPRYMHHKTFEKLEHEYVKVARKAINASLEQLPKGIGANHD